MPLSSGPFERAAIGNRLSLILVFLALAGSVGCGGGAGFSTGQPSQDFSLSPSASSLTVQQLAGPGQYSIGITPINGFSGSVSLTLLNLPAGVTISPAGPYSVSPGQNLALNFSASGSTPVNTAMITVQGSNGTLVHTTMLSITITAAISFQLNMSPPTLTLGPNGIGTAQLTLTPGANFGASTAFLDVPTHIPNTGVTVQLSNITLTAAQPQTTVTFQASSQLQSLSGIPVSITGTVGSVVVAAPFSLNINDPLTKCVSASRSTMRRTDMGTTGVVYDPLRKLVFTAVDQTNSIYALSAADAHTIGSTSIPSARDLDLTPDGSRLLVGSSGEYLSVVDPNTLQVLQHVTLPSTLVSPAEALTPLKPIALASGKVLIVAIPLARNTGIYALEWDPGTNTFSNPLPPGLSVDDLIFTRSADHSKVMGYSPEGSLITIFDSASDSFGAQQKIAVNAAALNSDGSRIGVLARSPVIPGGNQVTLLDSQFHSLATYQINTQNIPNGLIFSRDNSLLYVFAGGTILALKASDLTLTGVIPIASNGGVDGFSDVDETGMFFAPSSAERSVVFIDGSAPCAVGLNQPVNASLNPPQGTVSSPSQTSLTSVGGLAANSQIFFGAPPGSLQATPGTNLVYGGPNGIQVIPPSATLPGP